MMRTFDECYDIVKEQAYKKVFTDPESCKDDLEELAESLLTEEEFLNYCQGHYAPDNIVLSIWQNG